MNQRQSNIATIVLGAIISCFIGFYNGYPLVYPDTGTYLSSGFTGEIPMDRTIFYGLFARHISLSASPWLIIFAQGLIASWLLHLTFGMFFKDVKRNLYFLGTITFITLTTGYSFNVSILIPDIFSPIALLCLFNLLFNTRMRKLTLVLVSLVFIFSLATHLSNIPTFLLLLLFPLSYIIIRKIKKKEISIRPKRVLLPIVLLGFTLILIPLTHYAVGNKFQYASGSHVFMFNHLIECGVMEQYLNEKCEKSNFKVCEYKDDLGWEFIWDEESALYKTGGWEKNREEYNQIISEIFKTPKYWPILTQKTIEYTFKQFFAFEITVHPQQRHGSAPFGQIDWRYHDSVREYMSSKQNNNLLQTGHLNLIHLFVILISMVVAVMFAFYSHFKNKLGRDYLWMLMLALIYGLINSLVCANLSTVVPRYQNRWIWILPVLVIIGIVNLIIQSRKVNRI